MSESTRAPGKAEQGWHGLARTWKHRVCRSMERESAPLVGARRNVFWVLGSQPGGMVVRRAGAAGASLAAPRSSRHPAAPPSPFAALPAWATQSFAQPCN